MAEVLSASSSYPACAANADDTLLAVSHLHVRYALLGPIRAKLFNVTNRFLDAVLDI